MTQNTATYVGYEDFIEHGLIMPVSYADIVNPKPEPEPKPEDTRSCGEIAAEIFRNMKKKGGVT